MTNPQPIDRNQLTYRQSTSAIILDENKLLLIVQKAIYKDNEWDVPGGGVEEGETPEQTVLRELGEELGCNKFRIIKMSPQIDKYEWPDETIVQRLLEKGKTYRGQERIQFFVNFYGDKTEIKIQPKEIKAIKWVPLNELEKYLIFPNQLDKMIKILASETI